MVRSCLLITLIECLKIHKSLRSLCCVVKTLIVSLVRQTEGQTKGQTMSPIELFWTAKKGIFAETNENTVCRPLFRETENVLRKNSQVCIAWFSLLGIYYTRSSGALWAPTSSLRPFRPPFGPLDFFFLIFFLLFFGFFDILDFLDFFGFFTNHFS